MREAARHCGLVLSEAFHWRYHPLAARMKEIVTSGELGDVRHVEGHMCVAILDRRDSRVPAGARWRRHDALWLLRREHAPVPHRSRA